MALGQRCACWRAGFAAKDGTSVGQETLREMGENALASVVSHKFKTYQGDTTPWAVRILAEERDTQWLRWKPRRSRATFRRWCQPDAFREVMGGVATPVSVITSAIDGVPHGTTVSAFSSLSLEPAMILVCLDLKSELLAMILQSQRFGVNVLDSGGSEIAMAFARKGGDKFASVRPGPIPTGCRGWRASPGGWPAASIT